MIRNKGRDSEDERLRQVIAMGRIVSLWPVKRLRCGCGWSYEVGKPCEKCGHKE
jgi:hypothetical protein